MSAAVVQGLIHFLAPARIFHETAAATADVPFLPAVLRCSFGFAPGDHARDRQDRLPLRRTVQVRFGSNPLAVARCTALCPVSRQQFMKDPS